MPALRTFGLLLKDISRLYSRNFERHAGAIGMTLEQCRVLAQLERNEGISQARLAWLTDTDPMTLGRIVERLEADGLVERRPNPQDRRARTLYVTAAAAPVVQEIWRLSEAARGEAMAGLAGEEREQLMRLLKRIHGNLDALVPGAADRVGGTAKRTGAAARRANGGAACS